MMSARAAQKIQRAQVLSLVLEVDRSPPAESLNTTENLKSSVRVSSVADGAQLESERKTVAALFADIKR